MLGIFILVEIGYDYSYFGLGIDKYLGIYNTASIWCCCCFCVDNKNQAKTYTYLCNKILNVSKKDEPAFNGS